MPRDETSTLAKPRDVAELLMKHGVTHFAEFGYHGARIAAICRDAGVANGTFYLHFRDKAALFQAIARRGAERLQDRLAHISERADGSEDAALERMAAIVDFTIETIDFLRAGLTAGAAALDGGGLFEAYVDFAPRAVDHQPDDMDPKFLARIEFAMVTQSVLWWVDHTDEMSRDQLIVNLAQAARRLHS